MEALSCKPTSLKALMYSPLGFPLSPYTKNVCVKTSLRIWNQFRKHFNLKALSTTTPSSDYCNRFIEFCKSKVKNIRRNINPDQPDLPSDHAPRDGLALDHFAEVTQAK